MNDICSYVVVYYIITHIKHVAYWMFFVVCVHAVYTLHHYLGLCQI